MQAQVQYRHKCEGRCIRAGMQAPNIDKYTPKHTAVGKLPSKPTAPTTGHIRTSNASNLIQPQQCMRPVCMHPTSIHVPNQHARNQHACTRPVYMHPTDKHTPSNANTHSQACCRRFLQHSHSLLKQWHTDDAQSINLSTTMQLLLDLSLAFACRYFSSVQLCLALHSSRCSDY